MINRYNSIIIFLLLIVSLLIFTIIKINKVVHNTEYAKIENDSLKKTIIENNIEFDKKC